MGSFFEFLGWIFIGFGPLAIIAAGIIAMIMLAEKWQGRKKWLMFIFGPPVILGMTFVPLMVLSTPKSDNWAFVLGGIISFVFMALVVYVYYPLLVIKGAVDLARYWRRKRPEI